MKIMTDKITKALFIAILSLISVFVVISVVLICFEFGNADIYIFICSLCMGLLILMACYIYLKVQNKIIADASAKITQYISGNQNVRIECDEEGELNKLFHKINSLASTLNAHAENELKSKEFLKDTISDISHQLKTPLTALNIYNGILQDESENFPAIQEFAQLSEQELDRIETLVQNLLKITKLDAGTIVIDKKMENISEIMESVKRHFSFRAEKEGKVIGLSGDRDLDLLCDRNWLTEAIDNIVKNALDHTEKGDCISIKWECFASVVQIIINDNGSGIHPEDLYHIFKRFYRSRYSKDTQGIGLGLPLAKAIIEAHNGTIEVNSELGRGTSFIINFLIPTKL